MKRLRTFFIHLGWIAPLLVVAFYVVNPAGVPSWDPRGRLFGVIPYRAPSASMAPAYEPGDVVLACTWSDVRSAPRRGDVVVFWPPHDPRVPWLKRIIAVGGETIRFAGDTVTVDGRPLSEPYVAPGDVAYEFLEETVPPGHVFVVGDNRMNSADSRLFGPVPSASIIGRLCAR